MEQRAPETGRSASFRLRFRVVRGVRASGRGEAASACQVQGSPPHAGLVVGSSTPFAALLRSSAHGVYVGFKAKWIQIWTALRSLRVFYVGFMKVLHKTRVWSMLFRKRLIKTRVWRISCSKNLLKTRV